jgi:quinoprotein glucose dehydrogenase
MRPTAALLIAWLLLLELTPSSCPAQDAYKPYVIPPGTRPPKDALQALAQIRVPKGLKIDLFASEPLLANPVCFWIDEHNRIYVAETYRINAGVEDDRGHMDWLDDDMAARTVADRIAMFKKHRGERVKDYAVQEDRIRLLEDTRGIGKADRSTIFADGFNAVEDGIGAGVLARNGDVFYACIPSLYKLRDTKGTGRADVRQILHTGYGVHVAFVGHDLHGLRFGPDGKLYFSIGDRGFNVMSEGRQIANPDSGAVLRCNADGTGLEIVATGLRNPQELAFDQFGNLFTGDNNADHGDKARWVYVVEGGDSGWRTGFQYLTRPVDLGPWNAERLWFPHWEGQAGYIVPPIANVADGPAGLAYYPGVGLPDRYRDHFFLCDFRGTSGQSGIRSFAVKAKGASFEFVDQHEFIWSVLATDVDFGPDSALYILDWVHGWEGTGKGRIYRVTDPDQVNSPLAREIKALLADGIAKSNSEQLARLLEHPHMGVRQAAQFALAEKGEGSIAAFTGVIQSSKNQLARLHAIWGLGQLAHRHPESIASLPALLADADSEVRAQAAKVLGDCKSVSSYGSLVHALKDPEPRVRFFAAQSIGKLGKPEAEAEIIKMLRANDDKDLYLRHAGVVALTRLPDHTLIRKAGFDSSQAVRMAALLALRRLESPDIVQFLRYQEPRIQLEAARAINDVPIPAALPELAAQLDKAGGSEPLLDRVLNANFRLGREENARAVAAFATRNGVSERLRIEALEELLDWSKPAGLDRVVGLWRPLEPRPDSIPAQALAPHLSELLEGSDAVARLSSRLAARYKLKEAGPLICKLATSPERSAPTRVEALKALDALADPCLAEAVKTALADKEASVRAQARRLVAKVDPALACKQAAEALVQSVVADQQAALSILGDIHTPQAESVLTDWLDRLRAGQVPLSIQLDLLEAARRQGSSTLKSKVTEFENAREKGGPLDRFRECLAGGDAQAGRAVFLHKAETNCQRCHKIGSEGGEVGPDLSGIGGRQKREYLLESILDPNKEIAKGFDTAVLMMTSGQVLTGIIKSEDAQDLSLMTAEGKLLTVRKDQIDERRRGKSAMPDDVVKFLTKSEIRDLVEFLASQK